jgi:hypothetical protein
VTTTPLRRWTTSPVIVHPDALGEAARAKQAIAVLGPA